MAGENTDVKATVEEETVESVEVEEAADSFADELATILDGPHRAVEEEEKEAVEEDAEPTSEFDADELDAEEIEGPTMAELQEQNAALLKRLEAVEGVKPTVVVKEDPKDQKKTDEVSFLSEEDDLDELLGSREKLNAFAAKIYNMALEASGAMVTNAMHTQVPQTVLENVRNQLTLHEGVKEFYRENEDLLAVRKTVGAITDDVVAEHKDWTLRQVLEEAGKRTRETLGIKKRVKRAVDQDPAFVSGTNTRKGKRGKLNAEEQDILDLISD